MGQYALATPKGDRHIWYRGTFQFELNNGNFYSGYWEMDIHFRKPNPRCPTHTWSSSGPRPGPPSLTTGTSTRERRLRNPPRPNCLEEEALEFGQEVVPKMPKMPFLGIFFFFLSKKTCFSLIFGAMPGLIGDR